MLYTTREQLGRSGINTNTKDDSTRHQQSPAVINELVAKHQIALEVMMNVGEEVRTNPEIDAVNDHVYGKNKSRTIQQETIWFGFTHPYPYLTLNFFSYLPQRVHLVNDELQGSEYLYTTLTT